MIYVNQKFYRIIILLDIFWFFSTIQIFQEINFYSFIQFGTISFIIISINFYLFFVRNITLSLNETKEYLNVFKDKTLLKTYNLREIKTDDKKWAYVLDKKIILFTGIIYLAIEKKDLNLDILGNLLDKLTVVEENALFFYVFSKNTYFKWNLIAFLIMVISAIMGNI